MIRLTTYRILPFLILLFSYSHIVLAQETEDYETYVEDATLDLPEGMQMQEIDSLLADWQTRNFLAFDEACESTGENPQFDAKTYAHRLSRLPNVIDMPYNNVVQKYIDLYSGRLRNSVAILLGASNFYNPIFEEALESYQMPLELKYLPIIESALNPSAVSHAGAVGLWQFMITTGKQYGLEVTSLIDERRDPVKASYAAARYLRDLYDIFGDWSLAIAGYNCGPNNITKAIKRAGGIKDYWTIYPYLPAETRGYVPAFIAANYIMNYYCDHNICPVVCTLRMPTAAINAFVEAGDSIYVPLAEVTEPAEIPAVEQPRPNKSRSKRGGKYATVRKGDTLGSIARRNGTTVEHLRRLNGIRGNKVLYGTRIRVN